MTSKDKQKPGAAKKAIRTARKTSAKKKTTSAVSGKRTRRSPSVRSPSVGSDVSPVTGQKVKDLRGEKAELYQKLIDMRDQILDGIDFLAGDNLKRSQRDSSGDLSGYSIHMADVGTDNFDREFALSLASTERGMLYEIEESIRRLEAGGFGVCERCSVKIPLARLRALPYARYCVPCQQEAEKRMRLGLPPFEDHEEDDKDGDASFADEADFEEDDVAEALPETESSGDEDD